MYIYQPPSVVVPPFVVGSVWDAKVLDSTVEATVNETMEP